jgi:hypothetical protein
MTDKDSSFQLDRASRSFQPSDFRWRDTPRIILTLGVVFGLVAVLGSAIGFLPKDLRLPAAAVGVMLLVLSQQSQIRRLQSELRRYQVADFNSRLSPEAAAQIDALLPEAPNASRSEGLPQAVRVYREATGAPIDVAIAAVEARAARPRPALPGQTIPENE